MWPENLKATFVGKKKFFKIDNSFLLTLGLKTHVKKKGYKHLDAVLQKHGKAYESEYCILKPVFFAINDTTQ